MNSDYANHMISNEQKYDRIQRRANHHNCKELEASYHLCGQDHISAMTRLKKHG